MSAVGRCVGAVTKMPDSSNQPRYGASRGGYSPVITAEDGSVEVQLEHDHPGFSDPAYRERRNDIARLSMAYKSGDRIPQVQYSEQEHEVWRIVSKELTASHERGACRSYLEGKEELQLPSDHVPQLTEVSDLLKPLTGFSYEPVPGLAPLREFYGSFARGTFFSTQYIRHPSVPRYTPEPDIIHEVIGHANQLADPKIAEIYSAVGDAVARTKSPEALAFLSKVFWFTLEFGVVKEKGEYKAYGAGILSSIGELDFFTSANIRPLDFPEMGREEYDITRYQPVIYSFESMSELYERLEQFYDTYDDAAFAALTS
jgi:phenylalanine-4-hydroxylase